MPAIADRETLLMLLAQQHREPLLPASVLKVMDPLFHEARRHLDPYTGSGQCPLRAWPNKVAVVEQLQPLMPPKLASGVLGQVTQALQADLWLDVDYRNLDGAPINNKRVMPLALVQQGVRLYLDCQFDSYDDRRHLALHRVRRVKATDCPSNALASSCRPTCATGTSASAPARKSSCASNSTRPLRNCCGKDPSRSTKPSRPQHWDVSN